MTAPLRAQVRVDKFALFDLADQHDLSALACWCLDVLCRLARWQSRTWEGSYLDLGGFTRTGRDTTPKLIAELEKAGLIDVRKPFGPNRAGVVEIRAWDALIVGRSSDKSANENGTSPRDPDTVTRGQVADQSRTNRGLVADMSASDQQKSAGVRNKASKEEGTSQARAVQPVGGAPNEDGGGRVFGETLTEQASVSAATPNAHSGKEAPMRRPATPDQAREIRKLARQLGPEDVATAERLLPTMSASGADFFAHELGDKIREREQALADAFPGAQVEPPPRSTVQAEARSRLRRAAAIPLPPTRERNNP